MACALNRRCADVVTYLDHLRTANDSRVVFEATAANGETIYYDSASTAGEVSTNAVIAIIPVALVSLVTALKWGTAGIAIVVGGVLLMAVVEAVPKLMYKYRDRTRKNQCVYFDAHRQKNTVFIGRKTTRTTALRRGSWVGHTGNNVGRCSRSLAASLKPTGAPVVPGSHANEG